jgi:hypothetical protein
VRQWASAASPADLTATARALQAYLDVSTPAATTPATTDALHVTRMLLVTAAPAGEPVPVTGPARG